MPDPTSETDHLKGRGVAQHIRPLALVLFRRDDGAILVAPGFDPVKQQRFYRPLGGGIEFGESAEDAARREIHEELDAEIDGLKLRGTFENIFTYLGQQGHELIWLYEARFTDPAFYAQDVIIADESGAKFDVHWIQSDIFEKGKAPLYPDGLLALIQATASTDSAV
ncbi:MAG: NUDIX domain-containing protein [Dehalococcoidia bacterium]|nr:NUDIX domain-containing protein [Dehalococcoidia bacterium]